MIIAQPFEKAKFTYKDAGGQDKVVPVNFNPASLEYTITANSQGQGGQSSQVVGTSSAKLNMDLVFDTTDTGEDVRKKTHEVELLLKPAAGSGGQNAPPQVAPNVVFEWGAFKFEGVVDSFKQTMDFFSANGVPLRAGITLSISQPNYRFDQQSSSRKADLSAAVLLPRADASSIALAGGDPTAARGIALSNGLDSLRASASVELSIGGGISIGAAASFSAGATGGAGLEVGGLGSAFSELHTGSGPSAEAGAHFDARKVFAQISAPAVAPGATFDVTGKAISQGNSGFNSEVGATGRIRFDD